MSVPMDSSRPHFTGALSDGLADLAEEVKPVELLDRVRVSARRLAIRRAVLASTAIVAAIAAVSSVAWAALPQRGGPVQPATSPSATVTTEVTNVPETLFYVARDDKFHLFALNGTKASEVLSPKTGGCGLSVSPNGKRVAWTTGDGSGPGGDLIVSSIDGSGQRSVLSGVNCSGGDAPFWLPDSGHILVSKEDSGTRVLVDVNNGTVQDTPLGDVQGYVAWSRNGEYVAYTEDDKIVVARPDGSVVRRVAHNDEMPSEGFSVQGVSDDGTVAVLGMLNSDPTQIRGGFRMVDTTTGATIAFPEAVTPKEESDSGVYLLTGGQMLIRASNGDSVYTIYLISSDGKVLDQRAEPSVLGAAGAALLAPAQAER